MDTATLTTTPGTTTAQPWASAAAGGTGPAQPGPLDTHTSKVSTWVPVRASQGHRFELRRSIQSLVTDRPNTDDWTLSVPRVKTRTPDVELNGHLATMPPPVGRLWSCGRCVVSDHAGVARRGSALSVRGVTRCGRAMVCPTCGALVREVRRNHLERIVTAAGEHGLAPMFVTLTVRHRASQSLDDVLSIVRAAWRLVAAGREWDAAKTNLGGIGVVSALEVTHGKHGWHPHLHLVVIPGVGRWDRTNGAPATPGVYTAASDDDLARLGELIVSRWHTAVRSLGGSSTNNAQQVVKSWNSSGLVSYLAKEQWHSADDHKGLRSLSAEVTRADLKLSAKGASPFQLAAQASDGNRRARRLWWDYELAMRGLRWWRVSHHLAALLGVDTDDRTDDQIVDEVEEAGELLALVEARAWWRITSTPGAMSALCEAVASPDIQRLVVLLDSLAPDAWRFPEYS